MTAVESGSPAFQNGLRRGDVIYGVNRSRVRNVDEFFTALRNAEPPMRLVPGARRAAAGADHPVGYGRTGGGASFRVT